MSVKTIADTFPESWSYGHYEIAILHSLQQQIEHAWPDENVLLFNTTWMGPQTQDQIQALYQQGSKFTRLVISSTVDAALNFQVYPLIQQLERLFDIQHVYRVGNFDGNYEFNLFAIACADNFKHYSADELHMRSAKWRYCCYNRKPYTHRLQLVQELIAAGLESSGVITLGHSFPGEPDHGLYRSIGENNADYVEWGHWYTADADSTGHDIPHDLYSLHNWTVWQNHFLHIVGATAAFNEPDTFVNQINFKPLIGMRPWIINGQTKQYAYLKRAGFRTFNHYWPQYDLERNYTGDSGLALEIVNLVKWLCAQSDQEIQAMYTDMLPDLEYNRERWWEWAEEQRDQVNNLFK